MQSNIWKFAIHKATIVRMYLPIMAVYLLTLPETNTKTVGTVLLIAAISSVIFEIPSGYISDKIGHKTALAFARMMLILSTTAFFIGSSVAWFVLGAILLSLGRAFLSGTNEAFMHETLTELGRDNEYAKVMGKLSSLGNAISIVFIIAIPFLVKISYQAAFMVPLILDVIGAIAVLSLMQPTKTPQEIHEISTTHFSEVFKAGLRLKIFPYMILIALIMASVTAAEEFKEVYLLLLGVPIMYYGIFWAISKLIVAVLLLTNQKVKNTFTFHQFLGLKLFFAIILIGALKFVMTPILIIGIVILLAAFNWCFYEAENGYLLDIIKKSPFKSTLLSFRSLLYEGGIGPIAYMMGVVAL